MKIPKRVKVGGYTYQIKRKNKPFVSDESFSKGLYQVLNENEIF